MTERKQEENQWLEPLDLQKYLVQCLVFVEQKANLIIKDPVLSETVIRNGKDMITIRASSLSVSVKRSENDKQINTINSGEWIILLGSCDEEYELCMKNGRKLCYTLNAGKGPIYIIDCNSGRHFSFNQWSSDQQIEDICCGQRWDHNIEDQSDDRQSDQLISIETIQKSIKNGLSYKLVITDDLLKEKLIISDQLIKRNSTFDPMQVMQELRHFCEEYFTETNRSTKAMLSQNLNQYLPQIIAELCQRLTEDVLSKEPMVVMVQSPSIAFGDIHGNLQDLYDYENLFWNSSKEWVDDTNYLFLGDFVDRGPHSVEVSVYLFLLKLTEPEKFFLIRGNHEIRSVNKNYTFYKECIKKYGNQVGAQVWDQINCCFERLPIAAVVDGIVFCCHGGVPKSTTQLKDLMAIPKPLVRPDVEAPAAHELLWNDPVDSMSTYNRNTGPLLKERNVRFIANRARSTGFYYTELAVDDFFEANGFNHMIRAHESVKQGFKIHFNGKVVTVFSSSHYCGSNNSTACIKIGDNQIRPVILKSGSDHS